MYLETLLSLIAINFVPLRVRYVGSALYDVAIPDIGTDKLLIEMDTNFLTLSLVQY